MCDDVCLKFALDQRLELTLFKFIEFWQDEIEGPLHSVRFTHRKMIAPGEWRNVVGEFRVN